MLCFSEETLKAVGPFYLVSMPGEVKDPTQGVNVKLAVDSLNHMSHSRRVHEVAQSILLTTCTLQEDTTELN